MTPWLTIMAAVLAAAVALVALWPLRHARPRTPLIAMLLAVGVAGGALYTLVGTPQATGQAGNVAPATLRDGIQDLQQALAADPSRADGWALLGRSQMALGNLADANAAYARALQLAPDEPEVLVEAAQARAQADPGKQFDDTALQWLQHALQVAPQHERAAWLTGIAQRQRGQNAQAAATWEALLPRLAPGAAKALREQIAIAREQAGLPVAAAATAPAAGALTVQVSVDPALVARLPAGTAVFVIARAPGGPPMPVAVEKHTLADLPLQVTLDDSDSPMPTQPLSSLQAVEVFARLSASGNAARQEGDIDSTITLVRLPHEGLIELDLGTP